VSKTIPPFSGIANPRKRAYTLEGIWHNRSIKFPIKFNVSMIIKTSKDVFLKLSTQILIKTARIDKKDGSIKKEN
jgi:hypothetical protein